MQQQPTPSAVGQDGCVPASRRKRVRRAVQARSPLWLVHLFRLRPVPAPWGAALRAVLALALPIGVAFAVGKVEYGALISTGALSIVLADREGPYRMRAIRLSAAAAAAITGYLLGVLTNGSAVVSAVVVVLLAMASAVLSGAGESSSTAGLMLLVFGVVGAGTHFADLGVGVLLAGFAAGVAWSMLIALAGWTVRGTRPERTAVAQVFIELAAMLSAEDEATSRAARHQLTVAMNSAYDRLLTARARLPGRDAAYRFLLTTLSQATPVVEAAVAMVDAGRRTPRAVTDHLMRLAVAVLADTDLPSSPLPTGALDARDPLDALYRGLGRIGRGAERAPQQPAPLATWARELAAALVPDRATGRTMARLTLCIAIAEGVGLLLPFQHAYWIALTVGIVLKPELGSIFGRAVLRGIGTVVGVVLAAVVLLAHPNPAILGALCALFAAGVPIGKALNYGILSASITPLIIVQLDIQNLGDLSLLMERLVDTLIGCVIVLVAGYWLWPGSRKPRVAGRVADAIDRLREYVGLALSPPGSEDHRVQRSRARRRAYRALAELRTAFGQAFVEPSEAGRHAVALWPAIVTLEQVTDAVTGIAVVADRDRSWLPEAEVEILRDALTELAAAVREGRDPVLPSMPAADPLSTVSDQLRVVSETVSAAK